MPTRADHLTGRWTMSFMGWEPLPVGVTTLAEMLAEHGLHTAASVDTPYYLRNGMNYDRGFQSFFMNPGQDTMWSLIPQPGYHNEALDVREAWQNEGDRNAPRTFKTAIEWLEHHYKEDFFLYIDTWDPHEPWDAPAYYTVLYWPGYDGEVVLPVYGNWHDVPGYTEERLRKGHATYCGEITMVDTWLSFLMKSVDSLLRTLSDPPVTTVTAAEWSLLYSPQGGLSKLYNLNVDPNQVKKVMGAHTGEASELHRLLVQFMRETKVPERLLQPRLELRFRSAENCPRRVRKTGAPGSPPSRRSRRLCRTPGPHCSGRDSPGCYIFCGSDTQAHIRGRSGFPKITVYTGTFQ